MAVRDIRLIVNKGKINHDPVYGWSGPVHLQGMTVLLVFHRNLDEFKGTNQALHIVFACLPLLWVLGVLPPLEALLLWMGEQVHVYMLGGSPMASNIRYLLYDLVGGGGGHIFTLGE